MIGGGIDRKPGRARIEMQRGDARLTVQPMIFEHDIRRPQQLARADATTRTALAADLEQIGKIIVEQQREIETCRPVAVVLQADALIGGAAPQKDRAHDVQGILLQNQPAAAIDVGIGEVDGERGIVVAQIGAEQQRLHVVEHHLEPGEIAGVGVEQAVRPAGGGADVAMAVEHDKGVVMLERAPRPRRRARHRNVERLLRYLLDHALGGELRYFRLPW